jgi:hypothetical protein
MKAEIEIPEYTPSIGIRVEWDEGFEIVVHTSEDGVLISGNPSGLRSLAKLLLTLAQDSVPVHHHIHLDDSNALEDGSATLILERM